MKWIYDEHGQEVPVPDARRVGMEAAPLTDWFDTVLYALDKLRGDELKLDGSRDDATLTSLRIAINDVMCRLEPRLTGLTQALVRAHQQAGGSHGELASAMDVPRGTAQYRAMKVRIQEPSVWELWARGELGTVHETVPARTVQRGDVLVHDNHRNEQVVSVITETDGSLIYIKAGTVTDSAYTHESDEPVTIVRKNRDPKPEQSATRHVTDVAAVPTSEGTRPQAFCTFCDWTSESGDNPVAVGMIGRAHEMENNTSE